MKLTTFLLVLGGLVAAGATQQQAFRGQGKQVEVEISGRPDHDNDQCHEQMHAQRERIREQCRKDQEAAIQQVLTKERQRVWNCINSQG